MLEGSDLAKGLNAFSVPLIPSPQHQGWIEISPDEYSDSLVRVLDLGGMVWEGKKHYRTIDDALAEAEKAITDWLASS